VSVPSAEAHTERSADACFLPGQLVDGKYRVERLIAVGGMAAVWAGTNERTGKSVALKVILRALANTPAARELFSSEGLVASKVNHPNVVTIFDVIEHEGLTCIVMELLDGEPLSRMLERKGSLSVQEAIWLLLPAMRGVSAAHAQGIIHRDLKPQNIFLCAEPSGRIVTTKVLDFGISVLVERVLDLSRGLFVGTPNYMSPEHLTGAALIDGRTDVYGFGVLFFEALTGRMAFPGEQGPTLFHAILNEPAPLLTSLRPDVSSGLAGVIEKAMAKQPDKRYGSLNAMIIALEAELLAESLGEVSASASPGPSAPVVSPAPRKRIPHQETMVLHGSPTQAPESKAQAHTQVLAWEPPAPGATGNAAVRVQSGILALPPKMGGSSRMAWMVGLATVLGGGLGFLAWNATRPAAQVGGSPPEWSAGTVQVAPSVAPVAAPAFVAEPPAPVLSQPAAAESGASEKPPLVLDRKRAGRSRSAMVVSAARAREASQAGVSRKPRGEVGPSEARPGPRVNTTARPPVRAGTLTVEDF
jgi:eukaryotic-like serine/threonine-protein kinase